jgi:cytochrome c-type biogenesis protein CcmH
VPARFYIALAAAQAGDARSAIDQWQRLAVDVPGANIRAELQRRIAETAQSAGIPAPALVAAAAATVPAASTGTTDAAPGPTAEDMANAQRTSGEDRRAMIRSMVERLATRLKAEPDDLDGWQRLARAYDVLGDRAHAADAYAQIERLKAR